MGVEIPLGPSMPKFPSRSELAAPRGLSGPVNAAGLQGAIADGHREVVGQFRMAGLASYDAEIFGGFHQPRPKSSCQARLTHGAIAAGRQMVGGERDPYRTALPRLRAAGRRDLSSDPFGITSFGPESLNLSRA